MKTIANIIHKKNYPISIYDDTGNLVYCETSDGRWAKYGYDDNGNEIYLENSYGYVEYNIT